MARKSRIAVLDAETDPFLAGREPQPFVWGFYDGDEYNTFWGEDNLCTEFLIEHLQEYPYPLTIYAHNGGKFDFFFLLEHFDRRSIRLINGRISEATLLDGKIKLRDSFNIIPVPQKYFGKDDIEYWKMEKAYRNVYRAKILAYLQTDCFELYDKVTEFIKRFGHKLTLATAAMKSQIETIETKTRRKVERFSERQDERFRPYFYGGRCQAFEKGIIRPKDGKLKVFDINSAYPYAMTHEHPDPTYNSFYVTDQLPKNIDCYFAHIKAISRGALPYRFPADWHVVKDRKKLIFPDDNIEREYFVTGWEIKAGIETGTLKVTQVIKVRVPDKVIDFKEYILPLYEEKKNAKAEGRKTDELFAKLLQNAGYGKWALNPREFKEYVIVEAGELPPVSKDDKNPYLWKSTRSYPDYNIDIYDRPKHVPKEHYEDEEDYIQCRGFYNVSVAASITGFVRAYLWRHICAAKNPVYCDTDSIFCESFGGVTGKELGEWEEEGTADIAYIGGKKNYALRMIEGKGTRYYKGTHKADKEIHEEITTEGRRWKTATKGSRLRAWEIVSMVRQGKVIEWENKAPTYSLRMGTRFLTRQVKMT